MTRLNTTGKFVLFLLGVSVLPLLLVGAISYNTSRAVIQDEVSNYTQALLVRQKDYLELLLQSVESLIANVSGIEDIKQALGDDNPDSDTYTQLATRAKIGYILNGYLNLRGLVSIDIITLDGTHYHVGDTLSAGNIDWEAYQRIYDQANASRRLVAWTGVENNINSDSTYRQVVTAAKVLRTVNAEELQEEPRGLLLVTYSTDSLHEQFSQLELGKGAYMMIVDTSNRLVFHPDKALIGRQVAPTLINQMTGVQGSEVMTVEGQPMLVTYTRSEVSDWLLMSLVPVATLTASAETIRDTTLVLLLGAFGFIFLAAVVVTRTTVMPIRRITNLFKQLQAGTFDGTMRFHTRRQDEIGELLGWFDTFLDSLEARQRAESELLQAKESAESANRRITVLNKQLQTDNQRLENTLQELQTTQEELIKAEKLAALGHLIAGVAHEINTPLGAIRASINNNADILQHSLQQLPRLFELLSPTEQQLFFALLERSLQANQKPSARELRRYRRSLREELEAAAVEQADMIADILVDMEVYSDVQPLLPLFNNPQSDFVLHMAYDISGLQKNGQTMAIAVERASKVVFALRSYARYDQSGDKIEAQVTDGLETVLTLYHNQIKHGVELVRRYAQVPPVPCYPDELNQVWTNIIHNALQAMHYQGRLEIAVQHEADAVVVQITDSGPGIPPAVQARMFEPFYTTKPAGEGSGLGLSIVRKIIEKHAGQISVNSEPGSTTFIVRLPLAGPHNQANETNAPNAPNATDAPPKTARTIEASAPDDPAAPTGAEQEEPYERTGSYSVC